MGATQVEPAIGFVGLGNMGGAIARRLAGHVDLRVHDLRREAIDALLAAGARASSLEAIAEECSVVFTCLPRPEDVEAVVCGPGGLGSMLKPGSFVVDMTTSSPHADARISAALARRSIGFVDAGVAGGALGAAAGTLCIMVGGHSADVARVEPLLRVVSERVIHVGPPGSGHVMKLVNNFLVNANRLAACEGIAIAVERGIDVETCLEALALGTGHSQVTNGLFARFARDGVVKSTGFALGLAAKDTALARELFADSAIPSAVVEQTAALVADAERELGGDRDAAALLSRYGNFGLPSEC